MKIVVIASFLISFLIFTCNIYAQQNSAVVKSRTGTAVAANYTPFLDYQGMVIERYQPGPRLISVYTVTGNPYLFNGPVKSNIFSVNGTGYGVKTAYDTYTQNLEIFQGPIDMDKALVKEIAEIDSFSLQKDSNNPGYVSFINSKHLGDKKGMYMQMINAGKKYTLYKSYKTELVSDRTEPNRPDLREFAMRVDYYYTSTEKKGTKKLKLTPNGIKKEFPNDPEIDPIIGSGNLDGDTENVLMKIFTQLNSK